MPDVTPLLRLYARYRRGRLARMDGVEMQQRQLLRLVRTAADTPFGRDHRFTEIASVGDFQRRVPLRRYEEFRTGYWQDRFPDLTGATWPGKAPYLAVTSGTSAGRTKYIPVTAPMVRSNRQAGLDVLVHHLANRPRSRVFGGRSFMLGGSTGLVEEAPGIRSGDLTGIAMRELPAWARRLAFPPDRLARDADWERKIAAIAELSLREDIRNIAGTASWLLIYFDKLAELRPGACNLARFYPDLELVVHGGVNFVPYRSRFEQWLEGSHAELREVYPASEGFFAVADRGTGQGLRLHIDGGIFYEFVPASELGSDAPTRHWLADVETGIDYALVVSTCAGLWGYVVGDTVRLVSRDPPRVLVTGRTSYFLSAFGEHLTGDEIEEAVTAAAAEAGAVLADYSVGAVFPDGGEPRGGHLFIVEFAGHGAAIDADRFARTLDRHLSEENDDYRSHRAEGYGMKPPQVVVVSRGTFVAWMRSRGKLGGQNKVPRVIGDQALFSGLQRFAGDRTIARAAPDF